MPYIYTYIYIHYICSTYIVPLILSLLILIYLIKIKTACSDGCCNRWHLSIGWTYRTPPLLSPRAVWNAGHWVFTLHWLGSSEACDLTGCLRGCCFVFSGAMTKRHRRHFLLLCAVHLQRLWRFLIEPPFFVIFAAVCHFMFVLQDVWRILKKKNKERFALKFFVCWYITFPSQQQSSWFFFVKDKRDVWHLTEAKR